MALEEKEERCGRLVGRTAAEPLGTARGLAIKVFMENFVTVPPGIPYVTVHAEK